MAVLHDILAFAGDHLLLSCLGLISFYLSYTILKDDLITIPGPTLARFTDAWRFWTVWREKSASKLRELHDTYGDVVRIGPNCVDVSDPRAVELIYGVQKKFIKSTFYDAFKHIINGKKVEALFNTQNEELHAQMKKPIAKAYSMSALIDYEPFVDASAMQLVTQLGERFADTGEVCDLSIWLHYFALDVISHMTLGSPLGFLEAGEDIDGMIGTQRRLTTSMGVVGQMPWSDFVQRRNPILQRFRKPTLGYFPRFAQQKIKERVQSPLKADGEGKDFLDKFLEAKETHPEVVTDMAVVAYVMSNVIAGADSTASTLRAIMYYLLKSKKSLGKLKHELEEAAKQDKLSMPVPSWPESQELPYLDAVAKESMRLFPGVGLPLERVVPPGPGLVLPSGKVIPPGTIVGMSAPVVHRDESIFGPGPDRFVPERWLQAKGEEESTFHERVGAMRKADLTFGHGARSCLGKNISFLEIYKVVPTLLLNLEIELVSPDLEWQTFNAFFPYQTGINVHIKRRTSKGVPQ